MDGTLAVAVLFMAEDDEEYCMMSYNKILSIVDTSYTPEQSSKYRNLRNKQSVLTSSTLSLYSSNIIYN